jgi:hypothetical protein
MPDFQYTPELLAQLAAQLQQARATGLPWMIDNAQRAYDYARGNGADLPFDAAGVQTPGTPDLPPLPQQTIDANNQTAGAIGSADPAVFQPAPTPESPYSIDQLLQQIAAQQPAQAAVGATPAAGAGAGDVNAADPLATDPAYLAFQAALGLKRSDEDRSFSNQTDDLRNNATRHLAQLQTQFPQQQERLEGTYETRGLLHSGQHEVASARLQASQAQAAAPYSSDQIAQQIARAQEDHEARIRGFAVSDQQAQADARERIRTQQDQANYQQQTMAQQAQIAAQAQQAADRRWQDEQNLLRNPNATLSGSSTNPNAGIVGIVGPDPNSPDYLAQQIARIRGPV